MKSFEELGWKALDFHKHLYDSFICEDDLFLCVKSKESVTCVADRKKTCSGKYAEYDADQCAGQYLFKRTLLFLRSI